MSIHRIWKNQPVFLGRLTIDTQCKKDHVIARRAKPDVAIPSMIGRPKRCFLRSTGLPRGFAPRNDVVISNLFFC